MQRPGRHGNQRPTRAILSNSTRPTTSASGAGLVLLPIALSLLAGCGSIPSHTLTTGIPAALLREARPIGTGPRFQPPATGPITGRCRAALGPRTEVHVELFADNRVVIVPPGIGTRPPRTLYAGRITNARCYGDLVTIDPTGVVLVRTGQRATLSDLFRAWGQRLSPRRLGTFPAPGHTTVAVFVDGRRRYQPPGEVSLTPHAEIVLEVGPHVPPHTSYTFAPGR